MAVNFVGCLLLLLKWCWGSLLPGRPLYFAGRAHPGGWAWVVGVGWSGMVPWMHCLAVLLPSYLACPENARLPVHPPLPLPRLFLRPSPPLTRTVHVLLPVPQGGRVYDSKYGVTCHWCRQKTLEEHVTCTHPSCGEGRRLAVSFW